MKNNFFSMLLISFLVIGFTSVGWSKVIVTTESELPRDCVSIGYFEADAGYGKSQDGVRIALYRALKKASEAGASHAVVKQLDHGISSLNGYSLIEGFICPQEKELVY